MNNFVNTSSIQYIHKYIITIKYISYNDFSPYAQKAMSLFYIWVAPGSLCQCEPPFTYWMEPRTLNFCWMLPVTNEPIHTAVGIIASCRLTAALLGGFQLEIFDQVHHDIGLDGWFHLFDHVHHIGLDWFHLFYHVMEKFRRP